MSIMGSIYDDGYKLIQLKLLLCNNDTYVPTEESPYCKSIEEIEESMKVDAILFNLVLVNSYFDGEDYNKSVKFYA